MTLQEKILEAFLGKVVRKDLAFLVKGGLPVPTYVLEYLLGQYCASDDEEDIEQGLENAGFRITSQFWLDSYDEILRNARKSFSQEIKKRSKEKHSSIVMEYMQVPFGVASGLARFVQIEVI